jgi:SAM-dependent methyltransferase
MLTAVKTYFSTRSRKWRSDLFRKLMKPTEDTLILDLGGGKGTHMARFYPEAKNVHIADFNPDALEHARTQYGFIPHRVEATETLPFRDDQFDVVFCSSVIEHVTGDKEEVAAMFKRDGRTLKANAFRYQQRFAREIVRIGRRYFVQTPAREFPIETHTWLPITSWLPSHWQWRVMRVINRLPFPRKHTMPDWSLLTFKEMQELFPDATIYKEKLFGLTKSYIAVGPLIPKETELGDDPSRRM